MTDDNKAPVSNLVAEPRRLDNTKDDDTIAEDIKKQSHPIFISVSSAGKWRFMAFGNYLVMYFLMGVVITGDTFGLWHVQVDQAVLATFIGATIGSTIPLYLQFRIGNKSN